MRIAMVAPLMESVPPARYGGTERVVSILTEELVRRGHEVTLFASGDSNTSANLVACCERGLRFDDSVRDAVACTLHEAYEVFERDEEFDLIHGHIDYLIFPFARHSRTPTISTTHGRLDLDEVRRLYGRYPEQPLVSISDNQRTPLPDVNWIGTVYHGIDLDQLHFRAESGDYLVFLGRISPEKRPDRAIAIAEELGMRLVVAAKVDDADREYYEEHIAPMIAASPMTDFVGEVDVEEKDRLLGGAYAYLFPIDWPEPFGLTMVEAMATGTPVVAFRAGSVPEVVIDGVTGFVCDSVREMASAVERVGSLDRHACRAHVERHFSPAAMADGYERLYASVRASR